MFSKRDVLVAALGVVMCLVVLSVVVFFVNESIINANLAQKQETELVQDKTKYIIRGVVQRLDVGVRGYALTHNKVLLKPVALAKQDFKTTFDTLEAVLRRQHYPNMTEVLMLKGEVQKYIDFCDKMTEAVERENTDMFRAMFRQDRGTGLWNVYDPISRRISAFETALNRKAEEAQQQARITNVVIQLLLCLVGLPVLGLVMHRLVRLRRTQEKLVSRLDQNNRQYLFHPGTETEALSTEQAIENSILNFKQADAVISAISDNDYTTSWEGLTEQNRQENQNTLAGKLLKMGEKMKTVRQVEEQRSWATEGLAQFSGIVRNHQHAVESLSLEAVRFLVKYMQAQQGGLFIVQEAGTERHLELGACIAFDRKKFIQKRINIGEGLVGQTYLEAETVLLTEIPPGYTTITSGLGDATPRCLLVVPMKYNDTVEAVLEIASFNSYLPHQIEFIEKAGEFVASALVNARNTVRTKNLLGESQEQAEMMRAQEEEMRQNMEEMAATQEEMRRAQIDNEEYRQALEEVFKTVVEEKTLLEQQVEELKAKLASQPA